MFAVLWGHIPELGIVLMIVLFVLVVLAVRFVWSALFK